MRLAPIVVLLLSTIAANGQDPSAATHGAGVLDDLEQRTEEALARIPRATSFDEANRNRPALRSRLREATGIDRLPIVQDSRAAVLGAVSREGYRIEKVVFETLPDVFATGHLYLPDEAAAPAPAVVLYPGRSWEEGKSSPPAQIFASNMAKLGFAVLAFDPIGQGERQTDDEASYDPPAQLLGVSAQGLIQYEIRSALDYLVSRPEVDADRIGITGVADGFATWIATALDDRIRAAVVIDDTTDLSALIRRTRVSDWSGGPDAGEVVPGLIRFANNHELLAAIVPRPVLIIPAPQDVDGARTVYDYGMDLYSATNTARLGFLEVGEPGDQQPKRTAAYRWFARWLESAPDTGSIREQQTVVAPADSPQMRCLPEGQTLPAGPGISKALASLLKTVPASGGEDPTSLMGGVPPRHPVSYGLDTVPVQRCMFETQPGIEVPAVVLRPGPEGVDFEAGILIALADTGKESLVSDPLVTEALRRKWIIWAIDPRGTGASAVASPNWALAVSRLLGEDFTWRQGWDVYQLATAAANSMTHRVALYARGRTSTLAAAYAIYLDKSASLQWAVLRDGVVSLKDAARRPRLLQPLPTAPASLPFGLLQQTDLPAMLEQANVRIFLIDPADQPRLSETGRMTLANEDAFIHRDW